MRWLAASLLVAGCGRFGFDGVAMDTGADPDVRDPAITAREVTPPTFSTTSTEFVDVPEGRLVVPPSPGQTWLLLVSGYLSSTSMNYAGPEARYLVDGIERGLGGTEAIDPAQPGPWQHMYMFDGGTEPTTIQVQVRDTLAATTTLERLYVVVARIPASWDPLLASNDGPIVVSTPALTDVAELTLTPAAAGEYLLLLLMNENEAPSSSDIVTQWLDPAGVAWGDSFQISRGAWQSILLARTATLGC